MTSLLAQMNNYLQGLSAPTESEIIILTGGQASTDVKAVSDRIGPTIDLFTQSGWEDHFHNGSRHRSRFEIGAGRDQHGNRRGVL